MPQIHYDLSDSAALKKQEAAVLASLEQLSIFHWVRWQAFGIDASGGYRLLSYSDTQTCIVELYPNDLLLDSLELQKLIAEGRRPCTKFGKDDSGTVVNVFGEPCRVHFGPNSKAKKTKPHKAWGNYRDNYIEEAAKSVSDALRRWTEVAHMHADT